MKKTAFIFISIFVIIWSADAQQTFKKILGGNYKEVANDLVATADGGYALAGEISNSATEKSNMYISRVDVNGDLVWGKIFGTTNYEYADAITTTKDGGFAVAGSSMDAMALMKLDAGGNLLWSKTYTSERFNGAHSVIQTLDGGYAVGGYTQTYTNGSSGYFVKTDASGNVQWSKRLFDYSFYPSIQSMIQTKDSGFVCTLNARNLNSYYDVFIVKIDKKGNFVWGRSIGGESTESPQSIISTADGGFAVLASSFSFDSLLNANMYLIKLDLNANLQWSRIIGDSAGNEYGADLIQTSDGGFVSVGRTSVFGSGDEIYVTKTDLNGNLLYTKTIGTERSDIAMAVASRPDGSFLIGAQSDFYSATNNYEIMMLRFDSKSGICESTGSLGTARGNAAILFNQTVKVITATTTAGAGPILLASSGKVSTVCSETLPLRLLSFTAFESNSINKIEWTVTEESNIDAYIPERSNDGIEFVSLGAVKAKENTGTGNYYNFTDLHPVKAINYYRLKIVSKDGQTEYSEIKTVNNSGKLSVRLFTNPVQARIPLEFNAEKEEKAQIILMDSEGRIYNNIQTTISIGTTYMNIPSGNLPGGIYFISVKTAYDEINLKVIKR